jgi:kynurenine formamidase
VVRGGHLNRTQGGRSSFVELNYPLRNPMPVSPALAEPRIGRRPLIHEETSGFLVDKVEKLGSAGTHVHAPFHRFPEGQDLAGVPLEAVAGLPGLSVQASSLDGRAIRLSLDQQAVRGRAVLIRTGWAERWGTDRYWHPGPYLADDLVDILLRGKAWLVGVDCANVDDTNELARPIHDRLLAEGILIVEHLCNLERLPAEGFRFFAVPLRIVGGASFPVRAFAELGRF